MEFADIVLEFGLTRQEAAIYQTLLLHGDVTGYEAAKLTGISRSNTYNALAGLVDKGAAYVIEGQVTRYTPVPVKDFSANKIRHLKTLSEQLITCAPKPVVESEGYVTIKGQKHVMNQLKNMLHNVEHRIYILAGKELLNSVREELLQLQKAGKKVVIISDELVSEIEGAIVYQCSTKVEQFGVIADSQEVLTGDFDQGEHSACLYSKNRNFVSVYKEMLSDKIRLIVLQGGNET